MQDVLKLIGRDTELFSEDLSQWDQILKEIVSSSSFLVIGGAGSIGQSVVEQLFIRDPRRLHVVDINENNLTELVRQIRSTHGYNNGEFATFVLDVDSAEYDAFIRYQKHYDYVLNLSALKHVRSEKDPFTLMRMITVNIFNTKKTVIQSVSSQAKKYFCVSTDKAANPANMMGASKRIMEMFLYQLSSQVDISSARFANVAFSEGSLLAGFANRLQKHQPIAAPSDVRRYFVTLAESGQLCLLSCLLGKNLDIFFPKLRGDLDLITFSDIARRYLESQGYEAYVCASEEDARRSVHDLKRIKKWPCYFFKSDTTGEKDFEEFYTEGETIDLDRFKSVGVVANRPNIDLSKLKIFEQTISGFKAKGEWTKDQLKELFMQLIPQFDHKETGKYLDQKM